MLACDRSKAPPPPSDAPVAPRAAATAESTASAPALPGSVSPVPAPEPAPIESSPAPSGDAAAMKVPDAIAQRGFPLQIRMGSMTVKGSLPSDVILRVWRQSFGRFRVCYGDRLREKPNLEGAVVIKVVIDEQGEVKSSTPHSSSVHDAKLVECVRKAFIGMSFPAPETGVVNVTFPVLFSAGA